MAAKPKSAAEAMPPAKRAQAKPAAKPTPAVKRASAKPATKPTPAAKRAPAKPAAKPRPAAKPTPAATPRSAAKPKAKLAGKAVARAASAAAGHYLADQRAALETVTEPAPATSASAARKRGGADPLTAGLRSQLLPLLVLHFMSQGPTYGNQLIDRITELTGGVLTVNPNTMYPLLRGFESKGLIEGQWEHPERRSRRFYSLTPAGKRELARLQPAARKSLDSLGSTLAEIQGELFG